MMRHLILAVAIGCASTAAAQPAWPTKGWPNATPQSVGLNSAVLDSIDAEIKAGRYGYVDRMLVIRRGRVAYDRSYSQDYDKIYGDSLRAPGALNAHDEGSPYKTSTTRGGIRITAAAICTRCSR